MSRSVDLFIQSPRPIEEVASEMARLTSIELKPGHMPGTWALEEGDVHAELRAHPYLDDGDLVLERFQYALSSRVANGARTADSAEAALFRTVSEALGQGGIPSLLVHDLQYRDGTAAATEATPADGAVAPAGGAGPAATADGA